MKIYKLAIIPGDGIGPEVMAEVVRVLAWFRQKRGLAMDIAEDIVGGAAYDKRGVPLAPETLAKAARTTSAALPLPIARPAAHKAFHA